MLGSANDLKREAINTILQAAKADLQVIITIGQWYSGLVRPVENRLKNGELF
jgi:hypothetical protein